ncbi:MAG TPA: hypothetical protein VMT16_14780 [Thermoanaerobaculia bacterium]|nr:hypothetical protein [Thermoanaerobaculia bacterium]
MVELHRSLAAAAVTLAIAAGAPAAAVELRLAEPFPLRGEPTRVEVLDAEAGVAYELRVTYRPNSRTPRSETLQLAPEGTSAAWIPRDAGLAQLDLVAPGGAAAASLRAAVRFGGFPATGLLVMAVAGLLLFGGAALSMWLLLGETGPRVAEQLEPPST